MGTRIFCDNCGNTVQKVNVYTYGRALNIRHLSDQDVYQAMKGVQAGQFVSPGQGGAGHGISFPTQPETPHLRVELCDTCGPGWMERVKKLTQQSDPDVQS